MRTSPGYRRIRKDIPLKTWALKILLIFLFDKMAERETLGIMVVVIHGANMPIVTIYDVVLQI